MVMAINFETWEVAYYNPTKSDITFDGQDNINVDIFPTQN
jgi:hypothetical protein